ncbi:MAG: COX15/CtaA family protein [Balneolaceae bacterium]|nr:COX15/CtaA family protein [Balneolaceae bacterium]
MTSADKKHIRIWYWSGATLVFLILIIGGITRLTGSGLSMTDWKPIMGAIPPITDAQWQDAFDQYKQFPEYQQVNRGMSLAEFQFIFFWEYLHRMIGRLIGLVFIIPFGYFLVKKKFDATQVKRASLLLILGISQGLMGWYMVQSGLVDVPRVSPYRLAAHLSLAFIIFGFCVWFALDLKERTIRPGSGATELRKWLWIFLVILSLQVIWGAFVAGLHAGHIYNTFPKMHQFWIPPELWLMQPFAINFFENMVTVQWIHRVLATLLGLMAVGMWVRAYQTDTTFLTKKWILAVLAVVLAQYLIGVFTLVYHVPVWLGVLHQAVAMILFGVVIGALHQLRSFK